MIAQRFNQQSEGLVGWWTWLSKVIPDDAEAGGGLMVPRSCRSRPSRRTELPRRTAAIATDYQAIPIPDLPDCQFGADDLSFHFCASVAFSLRFSCDYQTLNLVGAFIDLRKAHVTIEPFNTIFARVTIRAGDVLDGHICREEFRVRRLFAMG